MLRSTIARSSCEMSRNISRAPNLASERSAQRGSKAAFKNAPMRVSIPAMDSATGVPARSRGAIWSRSRWPSSAETAYGPPVKSHTRMVMGLFTSAPPPAPVIPRNRSSRSSPQSPVRAGSDARGLGRGRIVVGPGNRHLSTLALALHLAQQPGGDDQHSAPSPRAAAAQTWKCGPPVRGQSDRPAGCGALPKPV